jgi:hypothetical protein
VADRLYLDTQQWNYFVERDGWSESELGELREALARKVADHQVRVLASAPLLQEIAGTKRKLPAKYGLMRDLLFATAGRLWLKPLNERHIEEASSGGVAPPARRYLKRDTRRALETMSRRAKDVDWIVDETHQEVTRFKAEQERIRHEIRTRLGIGFEMSQGQLRRLLDEWWAEGDVGSWVREIADEGANRLLLKSGPPPNANLRELFPSAWHLASFRLARVKLNLGEGRSIQRSDYFDAEHYASGAYFDVLVTDDKAFRDTCALIPDRPFRIEGFDDLVRRVRE